MVDKCVMCGEVIPEGTQVCPKCASNQKEMLDALIAGQETLQRSIKAERDEAVREFAQSLKATAFYPLGSQFTGRVVTEKRIDDLLEEMVGEG